MKKKYNFLMMMAVWLFTSLSVNAQETRIVKVDGWDPSSGESDTLYNNVLYDAILADTTERKTNPNVIFELTRNHKYPQGKTIKNYDFIFGFRAVC